MNVILEMIIIIQTKYELITCNSHSHFSGDCLRLIEMDGTVHENHLIDIHLNLIDF